MQTPLKLYVSSCRVTTVCYDIIEKLYSITKIQGYLRKSTSLTCNTNYISQAPWFSMPVKYNLGSMLGMYQIKSARACANCHDR
jgi:hypothetical protein